MTLFLTNGNKIATAGAVGVCVTDLRPAGTITVDGEPLDVVTEGSFVNAGVQVKVINVDGSRVLVRQI